MAVKAKAKKKVKRRAEIQGLFSPEAQKKAERRVRRMFDEFDERADEGYQYAMKILEANSPTVTDAVERMVTMMGKLAGPPRFIVDGVPVNVEPEMLARMQKKLHMWYAVRLLVACAEWDVRIADFKLPKGLCAKCGKKVK